MAELAATGGVDELPSLIGPGCVNVQASTGAEYLANDGGYTAAYIADPGSASSYTDPATQQQATSVAAGQCSAPAQGRRIGAFVGNDAYKNGQTLNGAGSDASAMALSEMNQRGSEGQIHYDQNSAGIMSAFSAVVGQMKPGFQGVLYFAGHGIEEGLVGVDAEEDATGHITDVVPYSAVAALGAGAVAGGYYLEIVVDACHSGTLVAATQEGLEASLAKRDDLSPAAQEVLELARLVQSIESYLGTPLSPSSALEYHAALIALADSFEGQTQDSSLMALPGDAAEFQSGTPSYRVDIASEMRSGMLEWAQAHASDPVASASPNDP